jgi:hypothetical protein
MVHPMFIIVLLMKLLFQEIIDELRHIGEIIRLHHNAHLHTDQRFQHMIDENLNVSKAAAKSLGDEQKVVSLIEKTEFALKMGRKAITWFKDLDSGSTTDDLRTQFEKVRWIKYPQPTKNSKVIEALNVSTKP